MFTSWMFFGLLGSLFQAAFVETNRVFKVEARQLNFWHVLIILVLFIPLLPYMDWPSDSSFYIFALTIAIGMAISMQILFNLARHHNGRVSGMYMPLEIVVAYGLWFAFYPEAMSVYRGDPVAQGGIFMAFCLFSLSMLMLRRNDAGWGAFLAVLPVAVFFGLRAVFSKIALMDAGENLLGQTLTFTFIIYLGILPISAFLLQANGGVRRLTTLPSLKAGFLCAIFALAAFLCFLMGVNLAANPALVIMMFMLAPVWLMLLHILIDVRDDASPWAGIGLIAGAMILIYTVA